MDPQQQNQGSFEVPQAQPDTTMIPSLPGAEARPAAPETAQATGAQTPSFAAMTPPQPVAPATAAIFQNSPPPASQPSLTATPAVADDLDLIEKEWVEKAKAIVDQTRSDPYNRNKEMNRFKADYLQKRYGKEIKLDEK